jgi:transposase-like protein
MRHTAAWWTDRVAELTKTGDARTVARRHGVKERTLKWWRLELRRRARDGKGARLLPVIVSTPPPSPAPVAVTADLEVFVEVGAARMSVRGAVSAEHLAAIVTASASTC